MHDIRFVTIAPDLQAYRRKADGQLRVGLRRMAAPFFRFPFCNALAAMQEHIDGKAAWNFAGHWRGFLGWRVKRECRHPNPRWLRALARAAGMAVARQ